MKTEWISVKDRLPEPGQRVLISFIGGLTGIPLIKIDYRVKYHNNTEWKNTYDNAVTHWQPLPEPPKE